MAKGGIPIINAVDRALLVMEALYHNEGEMGVSEIAAEMKLYKSTVFRTLVTLENKGYVYRNGTTGKYGLGLRLFALGMVVGEKMSIDRILAPHAKVLTDKYNEVFHYTILDLNARSRPQLILIYRMENDATLLKVTPQVGTSSLAHCSSSGKALLAFCDPAYLGRFEGCPLPGRTANSITDWKALGKELAAIRERGYAVDDEELEIGLTCVGVPILGNDGYAVGAISLSGPTSRMKAHDIEELVGDMKSVVEKVKSLLVLKNPNDLGR